MSEPVHASRHADRQQMLVIVGPTCVGKTKYTRRLLEVYPLEAINVDSFQVYSHFTIGTGRADLDGRPGHLYGFRDPKDRLSPDEYCGFLCTLLASLSDRGTHPLFEGGSISYLKALGQRYPLKVVGIRPASDQWMKWAIDQRIAAARETDLLREIKRGIDLGFRETLVLQDDVVYLPYLRYLDGVITIDSARSRVRSNLMERYHRQMEDYLSLDVEWFLADKDLLWRLAKIVEEVYGVTAPEHQGCESVSTP